MSRRFRLLPIVIFAGALALTLKVGTIWSLSGISLTEATAAAPKHGVASAPAPAAASRTAAPSTNVKKATVGDQFDPSSVTQSEFEVLQQLAKRRAQLDKRQSDLALREKVLAATEKRLDSKIAELHKLKGVIQGLLKKHDAMQNKELQRLVKIYERMKPQNAARIFERLNMNVLLDVIERMRDMKAAPILAAMDPARAKEITAKLAERRELPDPLSFAGGG